MVEFQMPEFYAPFPLECNPHLEEASLKMWEWIDQMGLARTARARARMQATRADLSGAYVWPHASLALLALGYKWLALTFRIDDQLDEDDREDRLEARAVAIAELQHVVHGGALAGRAVESSVPVRALAVLWQETEAGKPQDWRRAFVRDFDAFLTSYATEAALKSQGRVPDLREYLQVRQDSIGMLWLFDLSELGLPCFLPDHIRECAPMRRLRYAAALHIALVNDIYSLNREILVGYPCNAVLITMREQRCSPQRAVDAVADLVAEQARTFITARTELDRELDRRAVTATVRAAATAYADNCGDNIRGQIAWHSQVMRYDTEDLSSASPGDQPSFPDDLLGRHGPK